MKIFLQAQGERRFFRVVTKWLAINYPEVMARNLEHVPFFGRWDDLYVFVGTPLEKQAFNIMYHQLALDVKCNVPSLLAKWLKSENTSSKESRALGLATRNHFNMTAKEYRKTLSYLRDKIRVVEKLMSENRWDEIEFDKLPSKAGLIYRNAFARRDILKEKYEQFAKDTTTKVNADTLYPCEVVVQARNVANKPYDDVDRVMVNKYWDNLKDYFNNAIFNGVAVVDTSCSMLETSWNKIGNSVVPMDVAVALGMYCAEKCNPTSPWYGNYITFSRKARLVPVEGVDFVDKVNRIMDANLCENTDIESVFDLILSLAINNNIPQSDMPENIVIISDMEFDVSQRRYWGYDEKLFNETVMEKCANRFAAAGYKIPHLVFWDVDARNNTIPMRDNGNVTFVSGYSAVTFEMLMSGKKGIDFMLDKLNSNRYAIIQ